MLAPLDTFIELENRLTQINENNFDEIAWRVFHLQSENNEIYRKYLDLIKVNPFHLQRLEQIPFLPISFFKDYEIKTGAWLTQQIYKSSGTTDTSKSSHHLWDENFYLNHTATSFERLFGPLEDFHILALLPYYDMGHSSLVAMARHFIRRSQAEYSGFFLHDFDRLLALINRLKKSEKKVLLLGVSHALLDLVSLGPFLFPHVTVVETGGMKGRKEEIIRDELHARVRSGLGVNSVFSEYGMTELTSQAYSKTGGIFQCASTMKVFVKEINDPFSISKSTGIINVIDLANFHSCSFIETQDLGRVTENGFEVLGRVDNSEARGCNLLLA